MIAGIVLLASCTKRDYYNDEPVNVEYATVFYFENNNPLTIIRFDSDGTYALIESVDNNYPNDYDELSGIFDLGRRTIFNETQRRNMRVEILKYANTRDEAYDDFDYYTSRLGYAKMSMILRAPSKIMKIK
ncbi:hypothetical protein GCM10027516_23240 [Niabella aquatica]